MNSFSNLVAQKIAAARKTVAETLAMMDFTRLVDYFKQFTTDTVVSVNDFTDAVERIVKNMYFQVGSEEHKLLQVLISDKPERLSYKGLGPYLMVTKDEEIATIYLDRFLGLTPDFETKFAHNHDTVYRCGNALSVVEVMAPEQKYEFACAAFDLFPNLPAGTAQKSGMKDILEMIISRGPQRPAAPQQETILRVEKSATATNNNGRRNNTTTRRADRRLPAEKFYDPAQPTVEDMRVLEEYRKSNPAPSNTVLAEKMLGVAEGPKAPVKKTAPKKAKAKTAVVVDLAAAAAAAGVPEPAPALNGHAADAAPIIPVSETAPATETAVQ